MEFEVLDSHDQRYSTQWHRTSYDVGDRVVLKRDAGDGVVSMELVENIDVVSEALLYLASSIFSALQSVVEKRQLY